MPMRLDRPTLLKMIGLPGMAAVIWMMAMPIAATGSTDGQWEAIGSEEGVSLYRARVKIEGFLPFKAVADLDVPYEKIVMALVDAERKPIWSPKLKSAVVHRQLSANGFVYSEYYETPWPFDDREFLLSGRVRYEPDRVVFTAVNAPDVRLAREDHVTVDIQTLVVTIIPLAGNRTRVSFAFSGDLGGWIPPFVKTIIQKRWPVRFIQALKNYAATADQLETPRYRALEKSAVRIAAPSAAAGQ